MNDLMNSSEIDLMNEQGKCILIVEDDLYIRQALQMLLYEMGFDTFTAANGLEALQLFPRIPKPSLILLDLMMPVMNGWEFERELSKDELYSTIPIIILTAMHGKIPSIRHTEVMRKPLDLDTLVPIIKHHFFRGVYSESEASDFNDYHLPLIANQK